MSQSSISSQYRIQWQKQAQTTYDCQICVTTNTRELLELPCGHNLCLTCLHMICAYSSLLCPFCRCRLSTWLRHNPDYSKLIIRREKYQRGRKNSHKLRENTVQRQLEYRREVPRKKPTLDENGNISDDWLLAKRLHDEELEEFRFNHGRVTRSMTKRMKIF